MDYKIKQINVFNALLNDNRLTGSAKNQIRIFIEILSKEEDLGFDTTAALFYGFLKNDEFTNPENCPLTQREIQRAKEYFRQKAKIPRAKDFALVKRISYLPLSNLFGNKIDLKDLAVSFLTYATTEELSMFNFDRVKKIYKYLDIPEYYYLNVWDLSVGLKELGISYEDFIINLSRLKMNLSIPSQISSVSVLYNNIFNKIYDKLPYSLHDLSGNCSLPQK